MLTKKYDTTVIPVTYVGGILDGRKIKVDNKSTTVIHYYNTLNSTFIYELNLTTNTYNLKTITRKN